MNLVHTGCGYTAYAKRPVHTQIQTCHAFQTDKIIAVISTYLASNWGDDLTH